MTLDNYPDEYDEDEYYGTSITEDRKAFKEDLEHLYFLCTGILLCAISNWQAAVLAAVLTVAVRDIWRHFGRKKP